MKKRVLSLLMALTLCLTTLPTAVFADVTENGEGSGGTHYVAESGGIYAAPGSPTEVGGSTYIPGEDTRTEIWCVSKPDSIGRSYDGTTNGDTISLGTLGFTDGENSYTLTEGTDFTAKRTFDSADAGDRTVTVEITLIGEAANKYKLKVGKETFTIGGTINKAYPNLTVSLSKTTCTVGEKLLPLLSVKGAPEGAAVTYYYTQYESIAGDSEYEGSEAVPAIDENTAISSFDEEGNNTYYIYAKTGETKNYEEHRSATVALTVTEPAAASVTKADGTDGGTYESLPAALNAAQDGGTVKLLANHVTDWEVVDAGDESSLAIVTKQLTLDLNGNTVDYLMVGDVAVDAETQTITTVYPGKLTVVDSSSGTMGKIKDLDFVKGTLEIQSGQIGYEKSVTEGDGLAGGITCNGNSGSVTISDGRVLGLTVGEGASVTVSGGSEHAGNWHNDGTLNITGGTFGNVTFCNNGGTIAISGGTFSTIRNTDASATIAPISLLAPGHAFYDTYNENTVKDGSKNTPLTNVTVKEHTHTMVNNKCACGLSCTHTNTEGASTIGKDGKCTACGTQFAAVIGETYYTDVPSALDAAADGQTVKLLANAMLPYGIYASKTLTLDLDGHSLSGYGLNVGGLTATSQVRTGKLTVIDRSGGNGAVGVTVRNGGTLVFNPENDNTTLLQLEVYGGIVELYGGRISRNGLRLNNSITLGDLLPQKAGLAYYRGDTQLTLAEAASQACDLVVKLCSHGGKNGFDNNSTTCPYCNAPAVAQTALKKGEYGLLWRNFANLQDALDADRGGGAELTLLADVTGDYTIDGTQDTGLDLNGHSINGTLDVKAVAEGKNYTTTLSNTKNTTTASINEVVAHSGAKLAGSGYPAVIGKLWLADTTKWEYILSQPDRLGFKVLNEDGTHKWYAPTDKSMPAPLENVIINDLPITSKNLSFKVDGTNVKGNKVERGTTVQLCASCNAKDAEVYIYTGVPAGDGTFTYSQKKAEYKMIGKNWYYVVDFAANTVGKYSIYFTASKDGYSVTSNEKKLTVTKASIPESAITAPTAVTGSVYSRDLEHYLVQGGSVDAKYGTMQYSLDRRTWSNTVPTAKDAGTYSVYYKVAGAEGYEDSKISDPITVTIAPKELRITGVTFEEKTYDGVTYVKPTKAIFDDDGANKELELGDYSLSVTLKSTDAGTNVPFTATVKLKDSVTNYTLPNGTYYGFGEIKKAAAPTAQPGTLNVINGTQLTYTYDFKQLLPDVRYGSYGTVSYYCNPGADITLVQQSGYYLDETTVEFDNGVLTLAGLYAKDGTMVGPIGTVKVKVTTTNYEDFQLTLVLNAVNQTKPTPDGEITASNITYGQTLNESTITGKMKDPVSGETVNGTFAWKNGTVKPNASKNYQAEWTFTPAEGYEEYAIATGTVKVTVNPAALTGVSVTQDGALTYNGTAQAATVKTSATAKGDQSVTFTYSATKDGPYGEMPSFTDAGTHTVWYKAEANNHEAESGSFTVSIAAKAVNATIELSGTEFTYTGSAIEPTVTVKDGGTTISPSEYTVSYSANTNAGTATVTVTNRDGGNYTVSGSTTFEIQKADSTVTEAPAANSLTYSGSAQALVTAGTASGGKMQYRLGESGNFSADIPTAKDAGTYKVYYMVKGDSNHKDTGAVELTVTINKAALTGVSVKQDGALTYNGSAQTATVTESATAKGGQSVTFTYSATENGTFNAAVPSFTDAGSHTVWYKAKANNHETESGSFDVTISKAALESVSVKQDGALTYNGTAQAATVKTSATAKGGQNVTFTYSTEKDGTFNAAVPSFTNAGTHTIWYKAEANNHETASGSFTVSIAAKAVTVTALDKRVYVGAAAPDLTKPEEGKDYTVEGLLGGDKLTTIPTLTYDPAPKTHRANKDTKIVASAADAGGNYEISYVPGTLAVVDVPDTGKPLEPHPVNTPAQSENGAVSANPKEATRGTNVIVSVKPDEGCRLGDLTVVDENGNALEVVDRGNGQYVFVMPDGAVTIRASFVRDGASETSPFRDVSTDAYYYEAIKWAVDRGVTGGIGDGLFGPNQSCTRAQIVTFLWRAAGSPEPKSAAAFADVPAGAYYAKAVAWAVENGITTGTSETTFSPNAACTRAQSVTFLFRALGKLTESGETFRDVPKGSYYEDAVAWAAANGITTGIGGGLFGPNQSCTRAQIVTFLYRAYQGR